MQPRKTSIRRKKAVRFCCLDFVTPTSSANGLRASAQCGSLRKPGRRPTAPVPHANLLSVRRCSSSIRSAQQFGSKARHGLIHHSRLFPLPRWAATGANFSPDQGVRSDADRGLPATIDAEMGKIGPVPSGCGENPGSPAHDLCVLGWKSGVPGTRSLCAGVEIRGGNPAIHSLSASTLEPPKPSASASSDPIFARSATRLGSGNRP